MKHVYKWWQFTKERFNFLSYSGVIFVFFFSHVVLYDKIAHGSIIDGPMNTLRYFPILIAAYLFFFKLRIFDEIKDFDHDVVFHPQRPLPRGLITKDDALTMALVVILFEILMLIHYGLWSLIAITITTAYSLLMYKEFFCRKWIRSHVTIYAITHTLIVTLFSVTIFFALSDFSPMNIPMNLLFFSFAAWFIFNIFEFGRKTFSSEEEREGVDSYSKRFGKLGAVLLTLSMAAVSIVLINNSIVGTISHFLILLISLAAAGGMFVIFDHSSIAKFYRGFTSFYIMLFYIIVIGSTLYLL